MRISPRALGASLLSVTAGGLMVAACSDQSGPFLPPPPIEPPHEALAELRCTGSVPLQTVRCERADGSGSQSLLIVGGQHTNVSLYSNNIAVADFGADSVDFSFDVVVENLIRQPMGTQDTAAFAPDPSGVRVFFHTGPTATGGNGDIRVFNPTAVGTFTGSNQPYFEYDQVSRGGVVGPMPLFRNDSTTALNWILRMPDTVTDFAFTLYVSTQVPYQNGWTDVSPDSSVAAWRRFREDTVVVPVGAQVQLQGAVRDRVGRLEMTVPTYASSNDAVATVDAAGQVDALVLGSALISGMAAGRPSQRRTRVIVNNPSNLFPDSASALVNVTRSVAAPGVLANDNDPEDPLSVIPGPVTTAEGGTAVLNADGSFTYVSDAGETMARDSFMYHATDGAQEDSAWVVMKLENQGLWYVQADAAAGGTGTDQAPFQTIGGAQASAAATDSILVRASATELDEAVTLEAGQTLIGAGIEFDMTYTLADGAVQTVLSAGVAPVLAPQAAADAITLATDNTIRGLAVTAADGAGITGTGFGTLTTTRLALNPRGPALHLTSGTLDASIDILSSDSSATQGLYLSTVSGALTAPRGLILDAVGNAVEILSNGATLSLGDSIRSTRGAGGGIVVSMNSGAITFSAAEKTLNTGASNGVGIMGNSGSILFSGGGLAITTTSGTGFGGALSGGTLEVTGAGNTVSSGTGVSVALNTLQLGAAGVTFVSVSANGGTNGILLQSLTGGGLQVTGDGATDGSGGTIQNTTGSGVSLTSVVETELSFLDVTQSSAFPAIAGSSFGTLTVDNVAVTATGGPALSLATGTLNGDFGSLVSTNSTTSGVILNAVDGSFTAGGSITGAAGTAFDVVGGTVTMGYTGDITQANNAALLSVSGSHATGTLTFGTGTLSATGGTGLQFNDADGIYVFSGTTTLGGGDAGIDITNGSAGTFTFGTGTTVTGPSGSAFAVNGSSPTVTYSGSLTKANAGLLVEIGEQPGGTITFQTGTLSATLGTGISLSNADGTVNFNGTTTLNGGDAGVDVVAGSGGTFGFAATTTITDPTGNGLHIVDSAPTALNYAGTITTGPASGRPVFVDGPAGHCGIVNVSGGVTSTGQGILVQDCTGGTVTFSGAKSLGTGANQAVTLTNNTGATIAFTTGGLAITTTTGTGFGASGGCTLSVSGAGNSITSGTGTALSLNGVTVGAGHMAFGNIIATGAANAVSLTNVTGTGAINVAASTVAGGAGAAILVTGGSADVNWNGNVAQATAAQPLLSVTGGHNGDLAFPSGTLSATNGTGMQFDNADGTYAFAGTTTLNGGDAGVDVTNGSAGTFTFPTSTSITSPSTGNLITILNSAPTFTYSGSLTKANNNVTGILAQSNSGGTITFNGDATTLDADPADVARTIQSGTAAAVSLVSNGGSTINFNGGGLNITTGSGAGFNATGGGTVNVTGAGNQVNANGGGTAVNIQNTTIGGSGVSFYRVDATGGGTNGIVLSSTGAGGFQVTGDGASDLANTTRGRTTARSGGGSIVLGSGGSIIGRSGDGVNLNSTGAVTLRNLVITGGAADGIDATSVQGLVLDNLQVMGHTNNRGVSAASTSGLKIFHSEINTNATSAAAGAASLYNVQLLDVTGTDSIMSTALHTAFGFVMRVANNSGTLNLRVENTQITGATNGIAAGIYPEGTSNVTANFQNDSIGHSSARGLQAATGTSSSAVFNLTVNNTAFRNNFVGIDAAQGSGGTYTFSLTNNRLQTNVASSAMAINVNRLGSPSFNAFGLFTGMISGNVIGTAGAANSGSDTGSGIEVESNGSGGNTRVAIVSNTIREVATHGIYVAAVDGNIGGTAPPTVEARIATNSVANLEAVGLDGIHVLPGALSTDDVTMCLDIVSNNSSGIRNGLRVRPSGLPAAPSTIQLEGWNGVTARATYFTSRPNTLAGGVAAYAEGAPSAPGGFVAVSNCNTP